MASLQAVTTSTEVGVSNVDAVEALFNDYSVPDEIHHKITETPKESYPAKLSMWGYAELRAYPSRENGDPNRRAGVATEQFLSELSSHIAPDEVFDVQCAGYTKCRHPVLAKRYRITTDSVEIARLNEFEQLC